MNPVTNASATLGAMSALMTRFAKADGAWTTAIPRLSFIRYSVPHQPMPAHYPPCFCLITQGSKSIAFGDDRLVYDAARFVVAAVDLPVTGVVLDASPEKPYLCVMLEIDTPELSSLLLDTEAPAQADPAPRRGLFLGEASAAFVDAVWRLMRLLDTPADIRALAPLAEREVLYRLVQSNAGPRLRDVVAGNGPARRIAQSIAWLRSHYDGPLRVERLARAAHMSPSSFHAHFKRVTAMSPLQYQKLLRLQEARRLLMADAVDAATAGHRVGYQSPSQFSREYRRAFGTPPGADYRQLRSARSAATA
ncbi:MAG TPA: AraC family transcriptional regulator [Xanthobacteraceae bacterium]|nr:AraC family transcriptional regulator [Xanthobacteraceae bacterium]